MVGTKGARTGGPESRRGRWWASSEVVCRSAGHRERAHSSVTGARSRLAGGATDRVTESRPAPPPGQVRRLATFFRLERTCCGKILGHGPAGYGVVGVGVLPGEFFFRSGLSCRDLGLAWVTESSEATAMPTKHRVSMPGPPPNNAMNQTNRGVTVSGSGAPVESPC